ncbi:hypothetical protein B0J11DRAFT_71676 [Dendryphion nanum]|uniref:Uncharacterized protein n=1 Tax=Dendryphion nanum TaxID=256645 RepID=A0A9P9DI54_9PLEO|nr:hypothetical protein B0J11DRAFT_71676 [Dendryphion nanum]
MSDPQEQPLLSNLTAEERRPTWSEENGIIRISQIPSSEPVNGERLNIVKDVSAEEDSHQVIVSTPPALITIDGVSAAVRSRQWLGQISDRTLQHFVQVSEHTSQATHRHSTANIPFENQYGPGHNLKD